MALQNFVGNSELWIPPSFALHGNTPSPILSDQFTLDADEEEAQVIGRVYLVAGSGSKTFGTSGSKIGWFAGASNTFQATANLRVGVKKSTAIDIANGPPGRATIGAAAFDVYGDLVGGTATINNTTWREDAMTAGTPFTVSHGDLIALCWHLDITANAQNVKLRTFNAVQSLFSSSILVTSGPTYTAVNSIPNYIIIFDDGSIGWVEATVIGVTAAVEGSVGINNAAANIFQVPFACKVDTLCIVTQVSANTTNLTLALWSDPLGTPSIMASVDINAHIIRQVAAQAPIYVPIPTQTLSINTNYAVGALQTGVGNHNPWVITVSGSANYFKPWGFGAETYAAQSVAGAAFAAVDSGLSRYIMNARICALDDGAGAGAGGGQNRAILPSGVSALG